MGTHISRVKSVDLDSWTDEQLKSILSWGNARANKYWESKLAPGHVPSDAKIENFIRTKYELKRWVMDGPIPDPATLDADGDDDVPLSIVKEKQNIERKESVRRTGQDAAPSRSSRASAPQADLIGGDDIPPRASTVGPPPGHVPPKSAPAPPKAVNTKDSLLGLDFLGETPAAPPRPSSTVSATSAGSQSRPDLKQSILSLYASAPRPQAQSHHASHASSGSLSGFGGMQSPSFQSPAAGHQATPSAGGGLNDAFASLSFGATSPRSPPPQTDAFAGLTNMSSNRSSTPQSSSGFGNLGGGGFFSPKPAQPAAPQQQPKLSTNNSFGMFGSPAATSPKPAQSSSAALGDLFDWSNPSPPAVAPSVPKPAAPVQSSESVFNLSQPKPTPAPAVPAVSSSLASMNTAAIGGGSDVWGGNAWGNPDPAPAAAKSPPAMKSPSFGGGGDLGGWGAGGSFASQSLVPGASGGFSAAPKVAADEEFGGWTSSTGASNSNNSNSGAAKPTGGFGSEDLFSNVWQ